MKTDLRFLLIFAISCFAGVYVHEIGHAVAGWAQGIPAVPTPAKEYLLQPSVESHERTLISLGGVMGTALLVLACLFWYARESRPDADAILAGVLAPLCFYTIRFLLMGRGHDGTEWQEAQSAVGFSPAGHLVDLLFLFLFLAGSALWAIRRRSSLQPRSLLRAVGLMLGGVVLLAALQVVNNAIFDRFF